MKLFALILFTLGLFTNAYAIVEASNTYQPQWEVTEVETLSNKTRIVVTTPLKFCADELVEFNYELSSDVHGPIIVVSSLVRDNSRFKIFCLGMPNELKHVIEIEKNGEFLKELDVVVDHIHF
jgi:hypothetical protein